MIVILSVSRIAQRPRVIAGQSRAGSALPGPGIVPSGPPHSYDVHVSRRPEIAFDMTSPADELLDAVRAGDAGRVATLVAGDPALANTHDAAGLSAVMLARYRFDREVTDALLAADPDLDVFEAAALGYVDRLRAHLDDDPSGAVAFSPDGFTALHLAAFFGKPAAVRILLDGSARVDTYTHNEFANQPLHAAAAGGHAEVCRELLGAGADVNATQHGGFTPLHEAASAGSVELVELFLSAGGDPRSQTDAGQTPAELAEANGHEDLAHRLREVAAIG
jgi:ankyrin repeat protein